LGKAREGRVINRYDLTTIAVLHDWSQAMLKVAA
jgi:hypothetical protein